MSILLEKSVHICCICTILASVRRFAPTGAKRTRSGTIRPPGGARALQLSQRTSTRLLSSIASSGRSAVTVQPEAATRNTSRRPSLRLPRLTSRSRATCVSMETHFDVMNLARAPICWDADIGQPGQLRMRRKACHECEGCMPPRQLANCSHTKVCREPFQVVGSRHNLRGSSAESR